jgi:hypothetical protein
VRFVTVSNAKVMVTFKPPAAPLTQAVINAQAHTSLVTVILRTENVLIVVVPTSLEIVFVLLK